MKPALWATIGLALAAAWLTLTVHCNDGGNWTALYYTGGQSTVPPQLVDEDVFQFRGMSGYDGMFYHYVAHDPLMHRGFARYVDNVRLRWRRILVPGLASILAFGSDDYVDSLYFAVVLGFLWLGCFWLGRYCERNGLPAALGIAFAVLPPAMVSLDRMTVDISLAALCIGAAVVEGPWLYVLLAAAPLARETGLILIAAHLDLEPPMARQRLPCSVACVECLRPAKSRSGSDALARVSVQRHHRTNVTSRAVCADHAMARDRIGARLSGSAWHLARVSHCYFFRGAPPIRIPRAGLYSVRGICLHTREAGYLVRRLRLRPHAIADPDLAGADWSVLSSLVVFGARLDGDA